MASEDEDGQALTPTPFRVCTRVCTSEPENANADTLDADQCKGEENDEGDPLGKLAAVLLTLSPADRTKLAVMLIGHQGDEKGREAEREAQP